MSIDPAPSAQASTPTVTVTAQAPAPIKAFDSDDGPSFHDVLDVLNPLQHIPIINTIYRHLTGDEEGAVADVGGGTLWMGPVGLVGALADLAVKSDTGKSIGDNILSWLGLEDDDAPAETAKAAEVQVQQQQAQQAQQTAAVTAPLPAIAAQTLSPLPSRQRGDDRKDADRHDAAKDTPVTAGNYMVFGAAGSGQPLALTPQPAAQQVAAAPSAGRDASGPSRQGGYMVFGGSTQQQAQVPASVTVAADTPSAGRQGGYMVFGGAAQAGTPTPAAAAAAYSAPMQMAQAAPVPAPAPAAAPQSTLQPIGPTNVNAVANSVPPGGGPANLSPMPSRSFAAPARRTQVTPNALPMPTTGPGAVPGHATQSQALPAMSQGDTSWFVQAVNSGLDKYAAAQKLANQDNLPAAATAGAVQADNTIH